MIKEEGQEFWGKKRFTLCEVSYLEAKVLMRKGVVIFCIFWRNRRSRDDEGLLRHPIGKVIVLTAGAGLLLLHSLSELTAIPCALIGDGHDHKESHRG